MSPNPTPRCPLCEGLLIRQPVAGAKELHSVCLVHPPVGACRSCGILTGEAYEEPMLVAGRCRDCRKLAVSADRQAVVTR